MKFKFPQRIGPNAAFAGIWTSIAIFLLYAELFKIGDYALTIGGIACFSLILTQFLHAATAPPRYALALLAALVTPIAIYLGHLVIQSAYAVDGSRFFKSYALWATSCLCIWCGFCGSLKMDSKLTPLIFLIALLGVTQYICTAFLSWDGPYIFTDALYIRNLMDGYVGYYMSKDPRAIGPYYEPSMFGRVLATLCAIELVRSGFSKSTLTFVVLTTALVMASSRSTSFVVLLLGLVAPFVIQRIPPWLRIATTLATTLVAATIALKGLDFAPSTMDASFYRRVVQPMLVLKSVLSSYPFGTPIGANATISQTILSMQTQGFEAKITNGVYEFLILFGILGIAVVATLIALYAWAVFNDRPKVAFAIGVLVLSTAASSSFLSIESSFLISFALLVVSPRMDARPVVNAPSRPPMPAPA